MSAKLRVAVAGLGTVGSAFVSQLHSSKAKIQAETNCAIELVALCARTDKGFDFAYEFCADPLELAARDDLDLIVELIGGEADPAYPLVKKALEAGKHVITANKALLAKHGLELAALAEKKGVALNYEAAIAGGIPLVKALREGLAGDKVRSLKGILNGTSNYILCQMEDAGLTFDEALTEAQARGFAEADPSFDIYGDDAAHKLQLLIALAFGTHAPSIPKEGIDKIEPLDMKMANDLSYTVRLLAEAQMGEGSVITASVEPVLVALGTKISQSSGTDNMIGILTDQRHLFLEGEGAGAEPTAASVLADVIDIAHGNVLFPFGAPSQAIKKQAQVANDQPSSFYIRVSLMDRAGSMAALTNIMAKQGISLSAINQPPPMTMADIKDDLAAVVFITHPIERTQLQKALEALAALEQVLSKPLAIRIET